MDVLCMLQIYTKYLLTCNMSGVSQVASARKVTSLERLSFQKIESFLNKP